METSISSLVTVKFSALDLVKATTAFISDVAPDCLAENEPGMIISASSFLQAVITVDLDRVREAFANGEAMPSFCGIPGGDVDALFNDHVPCVIIEWPRVLGHHPVGEPAPVVREAITLKLIGDQVSW